MAKIFHRVGIKADAAKIYAALTTEQGLSGWWTTDTKADNKVGGHLEFRFGGGGPDMEVASLVPQKEVKWKCTAGPEGWTGTEITFQIKPDGDETYVLFSHDKWKTETDFMAHCSAKWVVFLLSLKKLVESGKGTPYPHEMKISADS